MKKTLAHLALLGCMGMACGGAESGPETRAGRPDAPPATTEKRLTGVDCNLYHQAACLLGTNNSSKTLAVHYAGMQFCKLQLMSTWDTVFEWDLQGVAKGLRATIPGSWASGFAPVEMTPRILGDVIEYDLTTESVYIAPVKIETRTGEGLSGFFDRTLNRMSGASGERSFVAIPVLCEKAQQQLQPLPLK